MLLSVIKSLGQNKWILYLVYICVIVGGNRNMREKCTIWISPHVLHNKEKTNEYYYTKSYSE